VPENIRKYQKISENIRKYQKISQNVTKCHLINLVSPLDDDTLDVVLWSISPTFFACNFCTKFWRQKFKTQNTAFIQNFGTKNALLNENGARNALMKLTP